MRTITITVPSVPALSDVRKGIKRWWNQKVAAFAAYLLDHTEIADDLAGIEASLTELDNTKCSSGDLDNFKDEWERSLEIDAGDVRGLDDHFSSSIETAMTDQDSDVCKTMKEMISEQVSAELARRESLRGDMRELGLLPR